MRTLWNQFSQVDTEVSSAKLTRSPAFEADIGASICGTIPPPPCSITRGCSVLFLVENDVLSDALVVVGGLTGGLVFIWVLFLEKKRSFSLGPVGSGGGEGVAASSSA